jgi:hypothetical protein
LHEKVTGLLPKEENDVSIIHVIRHPDGLVPGRICHYSAVVQIKKMKKSLPRFHSSDNPGRINPREKVLTRFRCFSKIDGSHLNPIYINSQLHEKEIYFTIRLF